MLDIGLGADHSCLVLDDGSVSCWGLNNEQQKDGTGTNNTNRVTVDLGKKAFTVESGWRHTCALLEDRSVQCWGRNNEGQTTNSTAGDKGIVQVNLGQDRSGRPLGALEIDLGKQHTCALLVNGKVKCWGRNSEKQKDGSNATSNTDMVTVDLGQGVTAKAIALGQSHTCVILNDDTVKCWGRNNENQLGTNGVPDLGQGRIAVAIATGRHHSCAILDKGSVKCWGANTFNQTGGGTPISSGAQDIS